MTGDDWEARMAARARASKAGAEAAETERLHVEHGPEPAWPEGLCDRCYRAELNPYNGWEYRRACYWGSCTHAHHKDEIWMATA